MPNLTIRNLDHWVIERLREQAKARNRSLQAMVREILTTHVHSLSRNVPPEAIAEHIAAMTPDVPQTDSTQIIRDDRDLRHIVKEMSSEARSYKKASLPNKPAVYGIFANKSGCLPAVQFKRSDFLYLGKSKELISRGHFQTGRTSSSTLRRTLGALLKEELGLHIYARGSGRNSKSFTNYRFDRKGEEKLTEWMSANLRIGFSIVIDNIDEIEKRLIPYCKPVLNLTSWSNPQAAKIKTLRKICAGEARTNGPIQNR